MKKMLGETGRGFYGHRGRPGKRGGSSPKGGSVVGKVLAKGADISGGRARFAAWSKQHSADYWKDVFSVVKRSELSARKARSKTAPSKKWRMISKTLGQ